MKFELKWLDFIIIFIIHLKQLQLVPDQQVFELSDYIWAFLIEQSKVCLMRFKGSRFYLLSGAIKVQGLLSLFNWKKKYPFMRIIMQKKRYSSWTSEILCLLACAWNWDFNWAFQLSLLFSVLFSAKKSIISGRCYIMCSKCLTPLAKF